MNVQPFNAQAPGISASLTSSASASTALPGQGSVVQFINEGPGACAVSIGAGTQTATLPNGTPSRTSKIIQSGENVVYGIPSDQVYNFSAISRTTSVLNIYVGEGQ